MNRFITTINHLENRIQYFYRNNTNIIHNITFFFITYGFINLNYNLIIKNQYNYLKNQFRLTNYYLELLI